MAPKTALAPKKVAPSDLLAPEFILAPVFRRQKCFLAPKSQKLAPKIGHLGPWPFYPNKRQLAPTIGANLAPIAHRQYIGANWRARPKVPLYLDFYKLKYSKLSSVNANSKLRKRRLSVFLPTVWNSLPLDLRSVHPIELFKSKLKTLLFLEAFPEDSRCGG